MIRINYNGVDGVFIPNNEFEEMKLKINTNSALFIQLIRELAPNLNIDELMASNSF